MQIIEMEKKHFEEIAVIFEKTLDTSIPKKLGKKFIIDIFLPFCIKDYQTKVFLHINDRVNGFIIITSLQKFYTSLIKSNILLFFFILVLKIIREPIFIKNIIKIFRIIKKTREFDYLERYSELLYMAVKDEKQNMNIGYELLNYSINYLKKGNNINLLIQTLLNKDGLKARKFYEKNSCSVFSIFEDRIWYIRNL